MPRRLTLVLGALAWAASAAGSSPAPATVPRVDLKRYAGTWYEVARYPNRFQKRCAGDVVARYALRPDGKLDVENRCRDAEGGESRAAGIGRIAPDAREDDSNAKLEVRFAPRILSWLPFVWADYWILELSEDYAYAVVGTPDREYLWILSRTPALSAPVLEKLRKAVEAKGYDPARLVATPQSAGSR